MRTLVVSVMLLTAAVFAGCKLHLPAFDSASVQMRSGGRLMAAGVLADFQVNAVREWLAVRKTGWEHRVESTAPALLVKLEHKGKVVTLMNIMQHEVKVGDFFRRITPEERDMLHLVLTTFINSKKEAN